MKIVLVSGIPIFPAHEGNRSRILALTRAIRELGHDLWLVLMPAGISSPNDREAHLAEFGADRLIELPAERPLGRATRFARWFPFRLRRKISRKLNLPTGFYSGLDEHYLPGWSKELAALHHQHGFDAAVVEYVFHSSALDVFPQGVRKVLDTHDAFTDRHVSYVARGITHDYWISLRPEEESRGFRRADTILAIQQQEAEVFQRQLGDNPANPAVAVVNHFLDLAEGPVADHAPRRGLFLASDNPANTLSARTFVDRILPLILARVPDFKLVLAGSICRVVEDHHAVIKLGRVERLLDAFEAAPLLVNPMLVGTGINIKILDALAAGVPTVSTDTGARGLPADIGDSVSVVPEQDFAAFADRVVELVEDEGLRRLLGSKARAAAVEWNERQRAALRDALEPRSRAETLQTRAA
jgi:glycosyltransferase involved in cell wall biosynthesis